MLLKQDDRFATARVQMTAFPNPQTDLLALFRRVFPPHIIAIIAQYGLSSTVSSKGIELLLIRNVQQHHVELLQAFALRLRSREWGLNHATSTDVAAAVEIIRALTDAFHAQRFLDGRDAEDQAPEEKAHLPTQMARNWKQSSHGIDIAGRLYAPLDELFLAEYGFSATELIRVSNALLEVHEERSRDRFNKIKQVFRVKTIPAMVRRYFAGFLPNEDADLFLTAIPREWTIDVVRRHLLADADGGLAQHYTYTARDLASVAGYQADLVERVLAALSLKPGALTRLDPQHLFLSNPVWSRPIIELDDDYFCSTPRSIFGYIHQIFHRLARTKQLKRALESRLRCFGN